MSLGMQDRWQHLVSLLELLSRYTTIKMSGGLYAFFHWAIVHKCELNRSLK